MTPSRLTCALGGNCLLLISIVRVVLAGDALQVRFDPPISVNWEAFNTIRLRVWKKQPASFFGHAVIEADGTMVETTGECKEGIDINHKGQWGYQPLVESLANTGEALYLLDRSGNRPSHEQAAEYLDRAINLCRQAGFRKITLRGGDYHVAYA